jgi:hypothetical protein
MDDRDERAEAPEVTWPGVPLAYDFVSLSYSWILQRLDAVDSRMQTLQAFAATITLGAPILAASVVKDVDFRSPWFALALVAFVAVVVTGAVARAWGSVTLITPKVLYDQWLGYSEWEFKKNAIYFAGQHFEANRSLVDRKGWAGLAMTALLLLEVASLLAWMVPQV